MMNKLIGITVGDIEGIGLNLLIKEWKNNKIKNFILISNYNILKSFTNISYKKMNILKDEKDIINFQINKLNILNIKTKNKYSNTIDSLKIAYKLANLNKIIGILTLPLSKEKINKYVDKSFIDQTNFFSSLENTNDSNMVFIFKNKFFIPLTTHIELKNVHSYFKNSNLIVKKIININKTLINDFKIKSPKLIIAGINPHAGENGVISNDENKYLLPIIKKVKKNAIKITGPISGDGLLSKNNLAKYNAFIFTYHDQALIPFKILSNFGGVNFTSNLKVIRVSPSHGTAVELIGKNIAKSDGIINSYKLINKISKNRK